MSAANIWVQLAESDPGLKDPGDAGAITNSQSGIVNLVTATAETRTLAAPTRDGLILILTLKTDGGDCTVTVASAINASSHTSIPLTDAGDTIMLFSVDIDGTYYWREFANVGITTA